MALKFELLENGTYAVSGKSRLELMLGDEADIEETIIIPSEHDGKPVTEIKEYGFSGYEGTVIVPKTIKKIGQYALRRASIIIYMDTFEQFKNMLTKSYHVCVDVKQLICTDETIIYKK